MFSGLTNQMSNWMGSAGKKQDGEIQKNDDEEQQSSSVVDDSATGSDNETKKDSSPTKASRLDMLGNLGNLGNVKSQMSGWLSGGIPGLRKTDAPTEITEGGENAALGVESPASEKSVKGSPVEKEEDDNSSATGGADSDAPEEEEGGDDKEGGQNFGAVSNKALQGAKNIGSFLFSAVNKAGKTVSEASAKIKKTVEENSLLGEFNKEQEAFIKEKLSKNGEEAVVPPWVGWPNEESLKEECLSLSTDRRNFVRSPPAGVDFQFDFETSQPVAMATLAEDPNLEKMRFDLVPKMISEENFWRNYFYRVSLICQASELNSMAQEGGANVDTNTNIQGESAVNPQAQNTTEASYNSSDSPLHEFVSDTFRASSQDLEEVREEMKKLGLDPTPVKEEEWDKELDAELQDYEVVADNDKKGSIQQWENQIEEMLDSEELTDLK